MTSTKIKKRSARRRMMLVAAVATPLAVILATGNMASAKKIIVTPADATFECQDSESAQAPFIVATAPVLGNDPASDPGAMGGPQVQVLVFQGNVGADYLDETLTADPYYVSPNKISDGESIEIEVPQGLYTVIFDMPKYYKDNGSEVAPDWKLDVADPVLVTCGGGGGGGGDYNFNFSIPKVTTPPLPKTGGDSNSMLTLAPALVLLGGALILIRRRVIA